MLLLLTQQRFYNRYNFKYFIGRTISLQSKIDMLDNLLEIEVAYSLLKSGDDGGQDPIDVHYKKLKTDIEVNFLLILLLILL